MPLLVTQCNVTVVEEDVEKLEEDDGIGPILQDDDEFCEVSNKLTNAQDRLKILRSKKSECQAVTAARIDIQIPILLTIISVSHSTSRNLALMNPYASLALPDPLICHVRAEVPYFRPSCSNIDIFLD